MWLIRVCVFAAFVGLLAPSQLGFAQGDVVVAIATGQREVFFPGEPILVEVELRNGTAGAIVRPLSGNWTLSLTDDTGAAVEDGALPGQPRFWVPPEPGESVAFSTVQPGETLMETFFLQNRFLVNEEGTYAVVFSVDVAEVVPNQSTEPFGPFFTVRSAPFSFQVSSNGVVWQQIAGPLFFHVVDEGGSLSLRFYRGPSSASEDPLFTDYTIVGQVAELTPPPELTESPAVTDRSGRVGVKFSAADGTRCAVVEIQDDLVNFAPPVLLPDATSACPPL